MWCDKKDYGMVIDLNVMFIVCVFCRAANVVIIHLVDSLRSDMKVIMFW